jgi:hypothetical protein
MKGLRLYDRLLRNYSSVNNRVAACGAGTMDFGVSSVGLPGLAQT